MNASHKPAPAPIRFSAFRSPAKAFLSAAVLACSWSIGLAQDYPTRPITIKVAFPAGGPADAAIRSANVVLQRSLGQPLITENVAGATGSISAMAVRNARPDGYTLLGTSGFDFVTAPVTVPSAKYQPESYRFLGLIGDADMILVSRPTFPFNNVNELIDYVKKPDNKQLSIGHWGKGSTAHVMGADFQSRAGVAFLEVPYKGGGPAISDMLGGHLDLAIVVLNGPTLELIQSKQIKAIGIASEKRNADLPDVQTFNESGLKNFDYSIWSGLFAPPDTPEPIVSRLNAALRDWAVSPENVVRAKANASRPIQPMTLAQAASFFKAEQEKFNTAVRSVKLETQ